MLEASVKDILIEHSRHHFIGTDFGSEVPEENYQTEPSVLTANLDYWLVIFHEFLCWLFWPHNLSLFYFKV